MSKCAYAEDPAVAEARPVRLPGLVAEIQGLCHGGALMQTLQSHRALEVSRHRRELGRDLGPMWWLRGCRHQADSGRDSNQYLACVSSKEVM